MSLTDEQVTTLREFGRRVREHPSLEFGRVMEQPEPLDSLVAVIRELGVGETERQGVQVSLRTILEHGPDAIIEICDTRRGPRVLTHLTRVVGYYSDVHNWNRSKKAELRDRQKQPHTVEEPLGSKAITNR